MFYQPNLTRLLPDVRFVPAQHELPFPRACCRDRAILKVCQVGTGSLPAPLGASFVSVITTAVNVGESGTASHYPKPRQGLTAIARPAGLHCAITGGDPCHLCEQPSAQYDDGSGTHSIAEDCEGGRRRPGTRSDHSSLDVTQAQRDDSWFCHSAVSVDHHGGQRGRERHGRNRTACGPPLRDHGLTAAHKSLPCGTRIRVTNKGNGRSTIVTITDRGPFVRGRVIDLSIGAAQALGFHGLARVSLGRI